MAKTVIELEKEREALREKSRAKDKNIRLQINRLQRGAIEQARKDLTREKIILGGIILARMQKDNVVKQEMQTAINALPEKQRRGLFAQNWIQKHRGKK